MSDFIASIGEIQDWIRRLGDEYETYFPTPRGTGNFRFAPVGEGSQIQFESYRPTITPPAKILLPARDEMFHFRRQQGGDVQADAAMDFTYRILAGVRPCDLKGIHILDLIFRDGEADPHYLSRRRNTTIIAYACPEPCDSRAFCHAVDSLDHRDGADVVITPIGGGDALVSGLTDAGGGLLDGLGWDSCNDGPAKRIGAVAARPDPFGRSFPVNTIDLVEAIGRHWETPVWQAHVERCFSCGTCNLVCPTCYCFDVHDELNLDAASGTRSRTWDGCMLPHFAGVAGGHNFRAKPESRQRHRVKRKFEYLPEKYQKGIVCMGCGRCGRQCTSGIDIFDIVKDLVEAGGQP